MWGLLIWAWKQPHCNHKIQRSKATQLHAENLNILRAILCLGKHNWLKKKLKYLQPKITDFVMTFMSYCIVGFNAFVVKIHIYFIFRHSKSLDSSCLFCYLGGKNLKWANNLIHKVKDIFKKYVICIFKIIFILFIVLL